MRKKSKRYKKKAGIKKVTLLSLVFILVFLLVGKTFGRFVYNEVRDFYLGTKSFYFNSDKLHDGLSNQEIDYWSGADNYAILINMNSYKNNKVGASSDISYDIRYECSDNAICNASKSNGIIYASTHTDSFVMNIRAKNQLKEGDSVWVKVYADAKKPYVKSLKGMFTLRVGKMGLSYEIEDVSNRPYMDVHITNTLDYYLVDEAFDEYSVGDRIDVNRYLSLSEDKRKKCTSALIKVNFDPNVVIMDMTNSVFLRATDMRTVMIDNYSYINGISFKVDALSSEIVRFYKANASMNYSYPLGSANSIVNVIFD